MVAAFGEVARRGFSVVAVEGWPGLARLGWSRRVSVTAPSKGRRSWSRPKRQLDAKVASSISALVRTPDGGPRGLSAARALSKWRAAP